MKIRGNVAHKFDNLAQGRKVGLANSRQEVAAVNVQRYTRGSLARTRTHDCPMPWFRSCCSQGCRVENE